MGDTSNMQSRTSNQYHQSYIDLTRSNNILLHRIIDHIHVTEATLREQLEHSRTTDRHMIDIINSSRNRYRSTENSRPATQEPSTQEPSTQEPSTQESSTQESSTQEHSTQEPATQEHSTQEPATQDILPHRTPMTQSFNWDSLLLSPVHILPSQSQIRNATTNTVFRDILQPINVLCPITQQQFQTHDDVTVIDHCRHIFTRLELAEWFGENVRCPVCRFDIRDHVQPEPEDNLDSEVSDTNTDANTDTDTNTDTVTDNNATVDNHQHSNSIEFGILTGLVDSINYELDRISNNTANENNIDNSWERRFFMDTSSNLGYSFILDSSFNLQNR
jgi:hypothetical protein